MRVVAFGIALVGVSVVGLGVVHNLLAYLLIDVVNGLASAICMGPMRTIIQTEADEKMVGRVFGLDTTMSTLSMPLDAFKGGLIDVTLASNMGEDTALADRIACQAIDKALKRHLERGGDNDTAEMLTGLHIDTMADIRDGRP